MISATGFSAPVGERCRLDDPWLGRRRVGVARVVEPEQSRVAAPAPRSGSPPLDPWSPKNSGAAAPKVLALRCVAFGARGASRPVVLGHDVDAAGALAVYLVGELASLPQRERAAEHGASVGRLLVRQVSDAPERELGRPPVGSAKAHRPALVAGGLRLDDQIQTGRQSVAYLATAGLRDVLEARERRARAWCKTSGNRGGVIAHRRRWGNTSGNAARALCPVGLWG